MRKARCFLFLLICFCFSGCASVALFGAGTVAGIGGYKYYNGSLIVIYQALYMKTWDSTTEALREMDLMIESSKHDQTSGKIKARRSDKVPVTVALKYLSADETEAAIRVGLFGDEAASNAIKESIGKALFEKK